MRHVGTHLECRYALASFGIPVNEDFPIDDCGNLSTTSHATFLQERVKLELLRKAQKLATNVIDYPTTSDVILGRGRPYHEWVGNLRLASLIDQHRETHQGLDRLSKTAASSQIVDFIKQSNGRFLRRADYEEDGWYVRSHHSARIVSAQIVCLRFLRRKQDGFLHIVIFTCRRSSHGIFCFNSIFALALWG